MSGAWLLRTQHILSLKMSFSSEQTPSNPYSADVRCPKRLSGCPARPWAWCLRSPTCLDCANHNLRVFLEQKPGYRVMGCQKLKASIVGFILFFLITLKFSHSFSADEAEIRIRSKKLISPLGLASQRHAALVLKSAVQWVNIKVALMDVLKGLMSYWNTENVFIM